MGRIRKEHSLTFDMSATENAPVAPTGAMRMRPKADGTTVQLSFNTGAYFDLGAGSGSGGTVRLDQVANPDIPATDPPTNRVKTFNMSDHSIAWGFTAAESEECFIIGSAPDAPGGGSLLLLQTLGASTNKAPFRVEGRGEFYFTIAPDGKVGIGVETGLVNRVTILQTNTGDAATGVIQGTAILATGNTATSINGAIFGITDNGNTAALQGTTLALVNSQSSSVVASSGRVLKMIDAAMYIAASTGIGQGLVVRPTVSNVATLTTWEAVRIVAPVFLSGGNITNTRAIITEAGAGYVGLGTTSPTVQLHVAGAIHNEQSAGHAFTIAKTTDTDETAQLDFRRSRTTDYLSDNNLAGHITFSGWFNPAYKQLGYIASAFNTTYGNAGVLELGAGDAGNARVRLLQTDAATGGVTIYGAASTPYFSVNNLGFIFSHGATGSLYYRNAAGYFSNLDIFDDPVPENADDEGKVLTVVNVSGSLLPRWMVPTVGGEPGTGEPAMPVDTLQYNSGGTFGAMLSSVVTGANLKLGGSLTLSGTTALVHIIEKTTTVGSGTEVGRILFRGDRSGTMTNFGMIRAYWNDAFSQNSVIEMGTFDATKRLLISDVAVTMEAGGGAHYIQVLGGGIRVSSGIDSGVFYQASGNFVCTPAGTTSQYLKGGATPSWGGLNAAHINAGVVPLMYGGTGVSLVDPDADRILFWDDSAVAMSWLTVGANLSIDGATNTLNAAASTGGTPALPVSTLQYNNAGAFGAVASSLVSGANLTLGGDLIVRNVTSDHMSVLVSAAGALPARVILTDYRDAAGGCQITFNRGRISGSTHTNLINGDVVARFLWRGQLAGVPETMMGYMHCWNDLTVAGGSRVDIGAGAMFGDDRAKVSISDTGATGSVTLFGGGGSSFYFQVQSAGLNTSIGTNGALFYKTTGNWLVPTASPSSFDQIPFWDNSAGQIRWLTLGANLSITDTTINAAGGSGGTPGAPVDTLQFNSGGSFAAVTSSFVSGANVKLGGVFTLSSSTALTHIIEKTTNVTSGTEVAKILFRGDKLGAMTDFGIIRAFVEAGQNTIEIGSPDATRRLYISPLAATLIAGSHFVQVQATGIGLSVATPSGVYYSTSSSLACTSAGTSSQYLKGGTTPSWGSIDASHITAGVLRLTTSTTSNNPTVIIDHTLSGSSTITNDYAQQIWFRHNHSGAISPATGARVGLTLVWDHQNGGTGGIGTFGDTILEMYAQNTGSISTAAYKLTAMTVVTYFPTVVGEFTAMRINGVNATTRRAIIVESGGGDVIINRGASLATNAKHGFLYIPAMDNPPNNSGDSITGVVPVGTCAIVLCKSNNALYANYGGGWMKIFFGGYLAE